MMADKWDRLSHAPGEWPEVGRARKGILRAYSKLRRLFLSQFRGGYVERSIATRGGECRRCGQCCRLVWKCPYLAGESECTIYEKRFKPCGFFPIDYWDLRWSVVPCGHSFERHPYRRWLGMFARYGRRELTVAFIIAALGIVLSAIWMWQLIPVFAVGIAFVGWFFRDPTRRVPDGEGVIVAPADGRVLEISSVEEPDFIGGEATRIAIFMSLLSVHTNRSPCSGEVRLVRHRKGRFHGAFRDKASEDNERQDLGIAVGENGDVPVLVRQIAGVLARSIVCDVAPGERLERGQRYGMIKFGSRAEVFVPRSRPFRVMVKKGQKVRAGETILGVFS